MFDTESQNMDGVRVRVRVEVRVRVRVNIRVKVRVRVWVLVRVRVRVETPELFWLENTITTKLNLVQVPGSRLGFWSGLGMKSIRARDE